MLASLSLENLLWTLKAVCTTCCQNRVVILLINQEDRCLWSFQLQKQAGAIIHFYTMLLIITNNRIFSHVCVLSVLSGFYVTS